MTTKSNPDAIFISDGADIFRTTNGGSSWQQINNNLPNKTITYIIIHPDNENIVWVTLSGYTTGEKVYKSLDGGNTWINWATPTLNSENITNIEHHRGSDGGVYIGTRQAVYYRDNTMNDWTLYNSNLPLQTFSVQLIPYYKDGKLDGLSESYYENGQLHIRWNTKDGKQEGLFESYHENGQLHIRGNIKDGKPDGLIEYFDEEGNQLKTEEYKEGVFTSE